MAALHFEFVSPEAVLFSGDVDQVDLPGSEGDMGILAGHAPLVTMLRPGIVQHGLLGHEVSPSQRPGHGLPIDSSIAEPLSFFALRSGPLHR